MVLQRKNEKTFEPIGIKWIPNWKSYHRFEFQVQCIVSVLWLGYDSLCIVWTFEAKSSSRIPEGNS